MVSEQGHLVKIGTLEELLGQVTLVLVMVMMVMMMMMMMRRRIYIDGNGEEDRRISIMHHKSMNKP